MPSITDYRGRRPSITWGPNGTGNTIAFAYPLDDAVAYPEPRAGSVRRRMPSGEEDAWTTGTRYVLACEVGWIPGATGLIGTEPQTGWDGATGWGAFLRHAWAGGAWSFTPNRDDPATAFPAVLLAPTEGEAPEPERDWTRRVALVFRRADGEAISGYRPAYRVRVFRPRSEQTTTPGQEVDLLTPVGGPTAAVPGVAPHSDPFRVATIQNVAGYRPYLGAVEGRRGELDVLERSVDAGQLTLSVLDARLAAASGEAGDNALRWASAYAGDTEGRNRLFGCRVEVDESLDAGASWTRYFTGRIEDAELEDRVVLRLVVVDLSTAFDAPCFVGHPHASINAVDAPTTGWASLQPLWPVGMPYAWGGFAVALALETVAGTVGGRRKLSLRGDSGNRTRKVTATQAVRELAESFYESGGLRSSPTDGLLFFADGTAEVHAWPALGAASARVRFPLRSAVLWPPTPATEEHYRLKEVTGYGPVPATLTNDASYRALIFKTGAPTEAFPLLVGRVHVATFVRALLDGKFGDLDPVTGAPLRTIAYDGTVAALEADATLPTIKVPVVEASTVLEAVERIAGPYGLALRVLPDGRASLLDLRLSAVSAATGLATLDDEALVDAPGAVRWGQTSRDAINRVTVTVYADSRLPREVEKGKGEFPAIPNTMFETSTLPVIVADNSGRARDLGDRPHAIDLIGARLGFVDGGSPPEESWLNSVTSAAQEVVDELRPPFAFGATALTTQITRAAARQVAIGRFVYLAFSAQIDQGAGARGGRRLAVCTGLTEDGPSAEASWLDVGGGLRAEPPVLTEFGAAAEGVGVTVTVTRNAAKDPVQLQLAERDPADGETNPALLAESAWRPAGRAEADAAVVLAAAAGARVFVRGRSVPSGGPAALPSVWVYPTAPSPLYVDLAGAEVPVVTVDQITFTSARVNWAVVPATAARVVIVAGDVPVSGLSGAVPVAQRFMADTVAAVVMTGLEPATLYTAFVTTGLDEDLRAGGATGRATFTTLGAGVLARPAGLDVVPGPVVDAAAEVRLGVAVTMFPAPGLSYPYWLAEVARDSLGVPDLAGYGREVVSSLVPGARTVFVYGPASELNDTLLAGTLVWVRVAYADGAASVTPASPWTCWRRGVVAALNLSVAPAPAVAPRLVGTTAAAATTGTLTLVQLDPQCRMRLVRARSKSGSAAETAYAELVIAGDAATLAAGGGSYTATVALVPGLASTITVERTFADTASGADVVLEETYTFGESGALGPPTVTPLWSAAGDLTVTVSGVARQTSARVLGLAGAAAPSEALVLASDALAGNPATSGVLVAAVAVGGTASVRAIGFAADGAASASAVLTFVRPADAAPDLSDYQLLAEKDQASGYAGYGANGLLVGVAGDPRTPTPPADDDDTSVANTEWVQAFVAQFGFAPGGAGTVPDADRSDEFDAGPLDGTQWGSLNVAASDFTTPGSLTFSVTAALGGFAQTLPLGDFTAIAKMSSTAVDGAAGTPSYGLMIVDQVGNGFAPNSWQHYIELTSPPTFRTQYAAGWNRAFGSSLVSTTLATRPAFLRIRRVGGTVYGAWSATGEAGSWQDERVTGQPNAPTYLAFFGYVSSGTATFAIDYLRYTNSGAADVSLGGTAPTNPATALAAEPLLTHDTPSAALTNPRRLLAGDGLAIDDSVARQRTHAVRISGIVPAGPTATGIAGQLARDADYLYVCVATNTWRRTLLDTWAAPPSNPGATIDTTSLLFRAHAGEGTSTTTDGATVASWNDERANGLGFTTGGNAARLGAYVASVAAANNRPGVAFASGKGMASNVSVAATPYTVYAVMSSTAATVASRRGLNATTNWLMGPRDNKWTGYAGSGVVAQVTAAALDTPVVLCMVVTGGGSTFYVNNVAIAGNPGSAAPGTLLIAQAVEAVVSTEPLLGILFDTAVYSIAHDATARTATAQALGAYVGVTI